MLGVLRSAVAASTVGHMTIERDNYLTPSQAGARMGVSGQTIRRWIKEKRIPAVLTLGGRYLIHKDDAVLRRPADPSK